MELKELVTRFVAAHDSNYLIANRPDSDIKYIVIHFTANDGDSDEGNANYFATGGRNASAHYFVDDDSITQSVDLHHIAWHCGGSLYSDYKTTGGATLRNICTNANSIGIEMCDTNKNGKYDLSDATRTNTIKLVTELMKEYNIDINHVVRHFDCSGKYCPRYFCPPYGSNDEWNIFKSQIVTEYNKQTIQAQPTQTEQPVTVTGSDCNYTVKVLVNDLNIRKEPKMGDNVVGQTGKGVFTIIKESNGWGLLKSKAGWVYLENKSYLIRTDATVKPYVPVVEYYTRYTGNSGSLVEALNSIGVDSSKANRKVIASKNGITNYSYTATQNTQLLNLLKKGTLKK